MKRWFPLMFMGFALLAKLFVHAVILSHPATWPPDGTVRMPPGVEAFAFLSGPVCLFLFWALWKPDAARKKTLSTTRLRAGTAALVTATIAWLFLVVQWLQAGWLATTPTQSPLYWLETSYGMYRFADVFLVVGGLLFLWLKGIRMPPHDSEEIM